MSTNKAPARIVFLDAETLPPSVILRRPNFAHDLVVHQRTASADVPERIAGADIVITNKVPVGEAALAAAPDLKLVAVAATGTDIVDRAVCERRGVAISNIRNYATTTVPEHTFALILALRRSLIAYRESVARGRWQAAGQFCYFDHPIADLAGSTIGIVGDGALGKSVAEIARGFRMNVLFSAYKGATCMGPLYTPFEETLRRSDIVTLHLPLMPSTRNLIGAAEFALMERRPLLINTARGGLVDEPALAAALRSGVIAGAGFDVATQEPPGADHTLMGLLDLPNFILTPHVAWASREATQALADQLIDNIDEFWRVRSRASAGNNV